MTLRFARLLLPTLALGLTGTALGVVPSATALAPAPSVAPAQAPEVDDLFAPLSGLSLSGPKVRVAPKHFAAFDLDVAGLAAELAQAPAPGDAARGAAPLEIEIPDPAGEPQRFAVVETVVGEPGFEAAHPEIRTYAGNGLDDTSLSIRMDVTPMGFHASVRSPGGLGAWYVDPAFDRRGETRHLSYRGAAVPRSADLFVERDLGDTAEAVAPVAQLGAPGGSVTQKDYRLAFTTDPTYAAYFGTANVAAEKATLINRVNQVYMDDLAIQFLLVAGTDALNLDTVAKASGPDGPCGANPCMSTDVYQADGSDGDTPDGCDGALLTRNVFITGQIIGADNFDIGHIGLGVNGGGVAGLGVVGGSSKARGCTGLPFPEGDFFAVDYVAHELGHQMGGNHTFNGTQANCAAPNRNTDTTLVEPGSGSSVMAYAGICQQDNLQPHSDPYFSFVSIQEITDTVADDSSTADEQQVVNLAGFDGSDAFTISCAGCPNGANTVTNGVGYNALSVANAVSAATGETVTALEVTDYDSGGFPAPLSFPSAAGFTVDFALAGTGVDVPKLVITPTAGTFTTFTGVTVNGGETTNEGTSETVANSNPVVTAPADKTIPVRTPFTLTGSGTDADPLVYLWEQTDTGVGTGTGLVDNNKLEGPLFRMFGVRADVSQAESLQSPSPDINLATSSPSRTFPDLAQVLADNTNAETGTCPAAPAAPAVVPVPTVECFAEFLPTAAYASSLLTGGVLNFRLSARDQRPVGGGYAYDDVELTVDPSAGPFLVTSQASPGATVLPGSTQTVTWAVNGTNAAGLAPNVRITLSTDGGLTFPTELLASTPNDGSQAVTIPAVESPAARIRVEAVGNYFFDVNDAAFVIGQAPDTTITAGPVAKSFVLARTVDFAASATRPGSTFVCTLDRRTIPCADSTRVKVKPGTHVFSVAARSPAGLVDPTPATRVFAAPLNDGQLSRVTKGWQRVKDKRSYRGAYLATSLKGQVLTRRASKITKVALVAHTGPRFGRVVVLFNGTPLRVVDLSGPAERKVLIKIAGLKGARSGTFTIRTLDDKPVRIDGLGLLARVKK
jgi:hypothetical protein